MSGLGVLAGKGRGGKGANGWMVVTTMVTMKVTAEDLSGCALTISRG